MTDGLSSVVCKTRGKLRQEAGDILVGDRVAYSLINEIDGDLAQGIIENIMPRVNQLIRPKIANITGAILVLSSVTPAPDWLLLDKMLVMAGYNALDIVICINKTDLAKGARSEEITEQSEIYGRSFKVMLSSAKDGSGVDELRQVLKPGVWVFAGASGVGKSSMLNAVVEELKMNVGKVSEKLGRGKHTTRHAEIIRLKDEIMIADTPGFSLLELPEGITDTELRYYYPEFEREERCRFDSCLHDREPDCYIKELAEQGKIDGGRYRRYLMLLQMLREREVKY